MNDIGRAQGEHSQQAVELEHLPGILAAASALSESVLQHVSTLNPAVAQKIVEQDASASGHWRCVVFARAPAEWRLGWKVKGEDTEIARGPGTRDACALEQDLFTGAQQFLQRALQDVSPQERVLVGQLMAQGVASFRLTCVFGGGRAWSVTLHLVVTGKHAGVWHIATLAEGVPPRAEMH